VVRYDTGDYGQVVTAGGVAAIREAGLGEAVDQLEDLVWLYGRDAVLPGPKGAAWPAAVEEALFADPVRAATITGAFRISRPKEDPRRVQVLVEARGSFDTDAAAEAVSQVLLDRHTPQVVRFEDPPLPFGKRAPHEFKGRRIEQGLQLSRITITDPRFAQIMKLRAAVFGAAKTDDDHSLLSEAQDAWASHWVVEGGNGGDRRVLAAMRVIHRPDGAFEDEGPLRLDFWRGGFSDEDMSQVGRLVAHRDVRGRLASTMLIRHLYLVLREKGARLVFLDCHKRLVKMYEQHGYRRFARSYTHELNNAQYERMVCFLEDVSYLEGIGADASVWAKALLSRFHSDDEARIWFEQNTEPEFAVELHAVVQHIAAPFRHYFSNAQLRDRATEFVRRSFGVGEVVVADGGNDRDFFIVVEGSVDASRLDADGSNIELGTLGPGDFFGELAALSGRPRSATVTVLEGGATLLALTPEQLRAELMERPALCISMLRVLADRYRRQDGTPRSDLPALAADGPTFTEEELQSLIGFARDHRSAGPGARLITSGTHGQEAYVVLEGSVTVHDGNGGLDLGRGRSVGEWGALERLPRSADVVAGPAGAELLVLQTAALVAAIQTVPGVGIKMVLHVGAMLYRRRAAG
jgi:CRP-like cAMP-binding protein/predicted GNAT family N-acyltransferase